MCFFAKFWQWAAAAKSTESQPIILAMLVHDETYRRRRELSYLAFRLVFRAGAAIRNVARSVQATSAESELQ